VWARPLHEKINASIFENPVEKPGISQPKQSLGFQRSAMDERRSVNGENLSFESDTFPPSCFIIERNGLCDDRAFISFRRVTSKSPTA